MTVVIIPAYKPDKALAAIADQLWSCGCRIVVVDDGSGEEYRHIFDGMKDICIVLTHQENRGKGAAVKTALNYIEKELWGCDVEFPIHTVYRDRRNSSSHFRVFWDSVRIYRDILKFTLSSLSSFALDYMLFFVLMLFFPHKAAYVFLANIAARVISACYNYAINCRFVFHAEGKASTAAGYIALAGLILAMNSVILEVFVNVLHFSVYPAKLLTEFLLFLASWLVQNCIIFRGDNRLRKV